MGQDLDGIRSQRCDSRRPASLIRANVSEKVQVKAAGGVRTLAGILDVIDAGVTRCGATATAVILDDFKAQQEGRKVEAKPDATPGAY